ncbi:MAG: NUDIX domain-containing protein [Bacteroidota bacterium]
MKFVNKDVQQLMERWDLYDRYRVKTGKIVQRGDLLDSDEFRLVVHVCIFNSNGQLLIQQRQPFKEGWPNMWDLTASGSAQTGETSNVAAERELFEEIGYKANLSNARPIFTANFKSGFDDYYTVEADINLDELVLQDAEVKSIKWAERNEIIESIRSGDFIPYHISVIDMVFDMKSRGGVHSK